MNHRIIAIIAIILPLSLLAQDFSHQSYDWEEKPERLELTDSEKEADAVLLLNRQIMEYVETEEGIDMYSTEHAIIRANTSRAIDENNKVFIPMRGDAEIVELKARSISPDGTITELNQDNIKDISNYEEYGNFKIFALEGAEVGSDLEYLYTLRKEPSMYGREVVQTSVPIRLAEYQIISPQRLVFDARAYNGLPAFKETKDEENDLRTISTTVKNVPPEVEELYSLGRANKLKFAYKLDLVYYQNGNARRFHTWKEVSGNIYNNLSAEDNSKALSKILKKEKLTNLSGEAQIKAVEQYFKTLINFNPNVPSSQVDDVLQQKYADENGMTRLLMEAFSQLDITYRLVVTSNRYESRFDDEFEDFTNLSEFLLYFPEYDAYITPGRPDHRYGYAPHYLADNYGLYITHSDFTGTFGTVKYIPLAPRTATASRNDITISFDKDMEFVEVDRVNTLKGYRAQSYRAGFEYSDENGREQFLEAVVKSGAPEAELLDSELENESIADISSGKPMIIKSKIKASSLLENAGDSYLFNVGMVIGLQSELYQEAERSQPIEMDYPMTYRHVIQFEIPDGYELIGLEDAELDKVYKGEEGPVARFVSTAKQDGNQITIEIDEYYEDIHFDIERYEEFREVINAAANFNKVVLVLEEK